MTMEFVPNYGESLPLEDIETLALIQASRLAWVLTPFDSEEKTAKFAGDFADRMQIELTQDDELYYELPPKNEAHRNGLRTITLEERRLEKLTHDFQPYGIGKAEVAELYLGTGIIPPLLMDGISLKDPVIVEQLAKRMCSSADLLASINNSAMLEPSEQSILAEIIKKGVIDGPALNGLRLSVGIMLLQNEEEPSITITNPELETEPTYQQRLTAQCLASLKNIIIESDPIARTQLMISQGLSKEEALRNIAENFSLLDLAVCFPMGTTEIKAIMDILRSARAET